MKIDGEIQSVSTGPASSDRWFLPWLTGATWIALGLLLILLLCAAWLGPDIFYHLFLGRAVLETHSAQPADHLLVQQPTFVNFYWLFQVVVYGFHALGGTVAVSGFFIGVWLLYFLFWQRATRAARHPALGLPLALATLLVFQTRFDLRPEVVSYCLLGMQVYWLTSWDFSERLGWRRFALFAGSEVLWVNVHGYFVFGPLLVIGLLIATLARPAGRGRRELREITRLLGFTLLATLVSPLGAEAWTGVFHLWRFLREMDTGILEFAPPTGVFLQSWTVKLFWLYWIATVLAGAWLIHRRRWRAFYLVLAIPGLYLSATSVRNMPLLPIFTAPIWGALLERHGGRRWTTASVIATVSGAVLLVATLLGLWTVSGGLYRSLRSETAFGIRLLPHAYPLGFHDYVDEHGIGGRIFNSAADGGYLQFHCAGIRPYMDSRYTHAGLVQEYFAGMSDPAVFVRLHERHDFHGALLKVVDSGPLLLAMLRDPSWRLVYADLHRAFVVDSRREGTASIPAQPPRIYRGEDLSRRINGLAAIQWVNLLIQAGDRERLLDGLEQLAGAPRIPSFAIQYALMDGLRRDDDAVIALAQTMAPRMVALDEESRLAVEELLRAAAERSERR